ncbi:MAG TPA: LysR substrate-binding domain-containing protein [Rhodanobacteraceae bacterium]|jgi:LysR family hydrogen peroxide-inducible transcriptional activator|nr:LysR substrate-binding domain-containing protein [Rhodanobacteraceae bacterium]
MNLRDLQYLVALADHKHFGHAAEASFVSQPTLSTQIRKLEDELGVKLVERTPRKVLLTEVGRQIVARARDVLNEAEQIKRIARRDRDPEAGTLRLGIFPTLGPYLLPHVMGTIRERYPRLELLLVEEKTPDLVQRLREGKLDAAILALPVHDDTLHAEFLFEEPFMLAAPETHPLTRRRTLKLADLEDERLLLLEDGHCLRDQALEVCRMAGADERQGFRATSLETLRQMVAANVGVTLLPVLAVQPPIAHTANVHLTPFRGRPPSRRIAMFWRRSSAMNGFLLQLSQVFKDLPPALLDPATLPTEPPPPAIVKSRQARYVGGKIHDKA